MSSLKDIDDKNIEKLLRMAGKTAPKIDENMVNWFQLWSLLCDVEKSVRAKSVVIQRVMYQRYSLRQIHQRHWNRVERSVRRVVSLIPIWQIISVRSVEWLCNKRMSQKLHNRRLESKRETIKDN